MTTKSSLIWLMGSTAVASVVQCSRPPADTVLECSASDLHHILRIRPTDHHVEDLSTAPPTRGVADVSDTEYVLNFLEHRDKYELRFRISKTSLRGTRELFDDEQQLIKGHGGFDEISCQPYVAH